jgi:hypothetical protein
MEYEACVRRRRRGDYAVSANNDLMWYRHDGRATGSNQWTAPEGKKVGTRWTVKQVFSSGNDVICAVTPDGELRWNRHDGFADRSVGWAANHGKKVGNVRVAEIFLAQPSLTPNCSANSPKVPLPCS